MLRIEWEFVAKEGKVTEFERAYGPDGDWARLFRLGRGYRRTELHVVAGAARTYRTVDVWDSRTDFEAFKREHAAEYAVIDRRCEELTAQERFIAQTEEP